MMTTLETIGKYSLVHEVPLASHIVVVYYDGRPLEGYGTLADSRDWVIWAINEGWN